MSERKMKRKIISMVQQPAMLCAIDTVPLTEKQQGKLEVAAMKINRRSCGYTLMHKMRNKDIKLGMKSISAKGRQAMWKDDRSI